MTVSTSSAGSARNALITAAVCAPLSLLRSCSIVLALVFGLWATTASGAVASDLDTASRVAVAVWLSAFGAHIEFAGGTWTLLPIGISALVLWSAHRAGRRGLRDLRATDKATVTWFLAGYLLLHICGITLLGWWLTHEGVQLEVGQCAVAATVSSLLIVTALAFSGHAGGAYRVTVPPLMRDAWAITRRASLVWLVIAVTYLLAALITEREQVAMVSAEFGRGSAVTVGVAAVSIILAPTVVGWLLTLSAGAAVAVAGSQVSVFADSASPLPPLPVMAAMPTSLPTWSAVLLLVPLLAFALAATRTVLDSTGQRIGAAVLVGLTAAALGAALVVVCGGGIGYPQWGAVGPTWTTPALTAAGSCRKQPRAVAGEPLGRRRARLDSYPVLAAATSDANPAAVVLLASGSGTLAQAVLDAAGGDYRVSALITDRPTAPVVERALEAGVAVHMLPVSDYDSRAAWDDALAYLLTELSPDLIVSAGFMRVIGPSVLARFEGRIINTHPSLLPAFPGAHAVRDALAAGATSTGATVHWVDHGVDTGAVLAQARVEVLPSDTQEGLHERIKEVERRLVVDVIRDLVRGKRREGT